MSEPLTKYALIRAVWCDGQCQSREHLDPVPHGHWMKAANVEARIAELEQERDAAVEEARYQCEYAKDIENESSRHLATVTAERDKWKQGHDDKEKA